MPANINLLITLILCSAVSATAQQPEINSIEPSAIAPGKSTRIVLKGENLDTNWTLWTSFPCRVAPVASVVSANPNAVASAVPADSFPANQITLPRDAPIGIGVIRAITPKGVSGFHLLMIDDLPTVTESASNHTISAAQEIKPPIAIDGACDDLNYDFYAFHARKGQQLAIEAVSQRLGSQADTVIRVLDQKGREYAFCDDGPGVGRDSRFIFKAPATARYLLEVRDMNYQGGVEYNYRLRIGSFPLLTIPYPPVIPRDKTTEILLSDRETIKIHPSNSPVACAVPAHIPVSLHGKAGSGFTSVLVSDLNEALETEPNDTLQNASPFLQSVCGRFDKPNDRDLFRFEAKQNQRLLISVRTRSLGSPCDVLLKILKADGSQLLEANPTGADEGTITNTFKETGVYFAQLQELTGNANHDFIYHLTVSPYEHGFDLFTEQDRWEPTKDGHFTLKVTCARRQYDGPITLTADGLTLEGNVIYEKKNETVLKLQPTTNFQRGKLAHFKITGHGDTNLHSPVTISTLPALRKQWPKLPLLPHELDGLIPLLVP